MKRQFNTTLVLLTSLIVATVFIILTSEDPIASVNIFFSKPFSSKWYFGNMLNNMALFIFASTGALFAFKTNCFNLGGEGQIYVSGLITAILLNHQWNIPFMLQLFIVFVILIIISASIGAFSGFLKMKYNISELLTSFLLSSTIIPLVNQLITTTLRGKTRNLLATAKIDSMFQLQHVLNPSNLNVSFFWAIITPILFGLIFLYTNIGYKLKISGIAPGFAKLSGFNSNINPIIGMAVSSMLHGVIGFFAITGTWYLCHLGFSNGMGWSGIAIALIAGNNFYAIIPASFLYAWLDTASSAGVLSGAFKFNTTIFLQAIIFLTISANFFTHLNKKQNRSKKLCNQ